MNRNYGLRYIPMVDGEWDKNKEYEHLVIVTHNGNSYTSKRVVPSGVDITNTQYWLCTGNYNAQVEHYRKEVVKMTKLIKESANGLNVVNVLDFGADNTGERDSTEAIQKAIDSIAKVNTSTWDEPTSGGIVYLPAGRYNVSDTIILRNCVSLEGAGRFSTRIFQLANTNKDIIKTEHYDDLIGSGLEWVDDGTHETVVPTDFAIRNLLIYGNQWDNEKGNGVCIYGYNYNIDNVTIFGCAESGIVCRRETGKGNYGRNEYKMIESNINNLHIMLCKNKGMEYYGATDARIDKLYISQCGHTGLFLQSSLDFGHVHIYDCCTEVTDNNDVIGHYGAWLNGTNKFDNLIVESCRYGGVYLDGYFSTISKLQLYGNGRGACDYPNLMVNNAHHSCIESCNINTMTNSISGVIVSGDKFTMNNTVIVGNDSIDYTNKYGIRNDGDFNTFDNLKVFDMKKGCAFMLAGTKSRKFNTVKAVCQDVGLVFSIGAGSAGYNDVDVKYSISSDQNSTSIGEGAILSNDKFIIRGQFGNNYYVDCNKNFA